MQRLIFKYPLPVAGEIIELDLPEDYAICEIGCQNEQICIWALIEPDKPSKKIRFMIFGTGWVIDNIEQLFFLKTIQMASGLVWHLFCFLDDLNFPCERGD